jgi:thioredoxin-related protein
MKQRIERYTLFGAVILIGLFILSGNGFTDSAINWYTNFDEAKAAAVESGKIRMVDFYTDWCGYCRLLNSSTFTNENVIELASNFISVKINAESTEGRPIAQKYSVRGFPTILFLDPNGNEIYKIGGYLPPEQYASELEKVLEHGSSLNTPAQPDALEPNDTREKARLIRVGETLDLNIHSAADEDFFVLQTQAGKSYLIETIGDMDTQLILLDQNGEALDQDDDSGENYNARLLHEAQTADRIVFSVIPYEYSPISNEYGIRIQEVVYNPDPNEGNNTIQTATPIRDGGSIKGTFHNMNDVDMFRLHLEPGILYQIETVGTLDTYMTIYDNNETELISDDDSGEEYNAKVIYGEEYALDVFIKISPYEWSGEMEEYTLTVKSIELEGGDRLEPNNFLGQAYQLALDTPLADLTIEPAYDRDWFTFQAEKGKKYAIVTTCEVDTVMHLYNQDSIELVYNDDYGEEYCSKIVFTAEYEGPFYVKVTGYDVESLGSYGIELYYTDEPETSEYYEEGEYDEGSVEEEIFSFLEGEWNLVSGFGTDLAVPSSIIFEAGDGYRADYSGGEGAIVEMGTFEIIDFSEDDNQPYVKLQIEILDTTGNTVNSVGDIVELTIEPDLEADMEESYHIFVNDIPYEQFFPMEQ